MLLRLPSALRKSLAARVLVTTIALFTIASGVIGTVIFGQIEDRIINERIESSIAEARSTISAAEFRFELAEQFNLGSGSVDLIKSNFDNALALAIAPSATVSAREIALLKSPENIASVDDYSVSSNSLEFTSIPSNLRERVASTSDIAWEITELRYPNGDVIPGIAVGKEVVAPWVGSYEMYVLFNFESQQDSIGIVARGLLVAYFFVFLSILSMTYLIFRRVVDPIRKVAEVAESFTAGDFSQRVVVTGEDEIAALGRAFNEMAFSIEQQISRLENLSRMQQRFVSDVSHELRNPLTTVRMAGEVIVGAKDRFDPIIARSAEILMTQVTRFDQLLTDLLEVSRFDAAVATLDYSPIDLLELLRETIDSLAVDSPRFRLVLPPDHATILVDADRRRVTRILRNLLSNALDHGEGKQVVISVAKRESSVDLGVRDFGVGLRPEQFERVFERFWRADPSRSRERGGTGLGLSIALEDAKLHGGGIRVFGEIGRGSLFLLTLPSAAGQPIIDPPIDIAQQFRSLG
jgi:two-component system sensor histidine kinase MtrB